MNLKAQLTKRQWDILELHAQGLIKEEIGEKLHISPHTVGTHLNNMHTRLGIKTRRELSKLYYDYIAEKAKQIVSNNTDQSYVVFGSCKNSLHNVTNSSKQKTGVEGFPVIQRSSKYFVVIPKTANYNYWESYKKDSNSSKEISIVNGKAVGVSPTGRIVISDNVKIKALPKKYFAMSFD
jgi:DNA-binding CsgD family transcriptional regulator